ncbi:hypothetical protein WJX77_002138 [Trebouxia sp. C0004]
MAGLLLDRWQGNPHAPFAQAFSLLARRVPVFTLNYSHHLSQALKSGRGGQGQRVPLNFIEYCSRAGAATVLNFLEAGGVGPVASMHGHYVLHINGRVFDAQSFVLTDEEYGLQLEDFRRHVSKVAQYRHLIGVGVGTGFLDSHFLAVWKDQRQLQLADQQVHTWNHYLLLRMLVFKGSSMTLLPALPTQTQTNQSCAVGFSST